jgi:hypothetical protein
VPILTFVSCVAFSLSFSAVIVYSSGKSPTWTNSPFLLVFDLATCSSPTSPRSSLGAYDRRTLRVDDLARTTPVCADAVAANASTTGRRKERPERGGGMPSEIIDVASSAFAPATRNSAETLLVYYCRAGPSRLARSATAAARQSLRRSRAVRPKRAEASPTYVGRSGRSRRAHVSPARGGMEARNRLPYPMVLSRGSSTASSPRSWRCRISGRDPAAKSEIAIGT